MGTFHLGVGADSLPGYNDIFPVGGDRQVRTELMHQFNDNSDAVTSVVSDSY